MPAGPLARVISKQKGKQMKRLYIIICAVLFLGAALLFLYWLNQDRGAPDFFEDP